LERFISTPATHHSHHAATINDGVGNYKGNFGNMFFIWDMIFKTGLISRKFPSSYGMKSYKQEEWQAQIFWPFIKSKIEGSALADERKLPQEKQKRETPATPVYVPANEFEDVPIA
jgi:hypothetical protein